MTDAMFTRTALTEAAETAGVTTDQARAILEAAGVTVQPEKPAPGWYLTEDGEVARVKPNKHTGALILHIDGDVLLPHQTWPQLTPARFVPAEGEPIDLDAVVREGNNQVRLLLANGDEVTITVTCVEKPRIESPPNLSRRRDIRAGYLLHREES